MIYWAPLLHFYQPPTQSSEVLKRICDECYRPVLSVFEDSESARATFNISGSLTELLREHDCYDIIDGIRSLAESGKIELTGTAMYHPILPLISDDERRRQITLNQRINRQVFGDVFRPVGFFPPELGFAPSIVSSIYETGHQWVLVSGVANQGDWPVDTIPRVTSVDGDLKVFFRDDVLSNRISFHDLSADDFIQALQSLKGERPNIYCVTAMDAETFGHHIPCWDKEFLAAAFRAIKRVEFRPAGWDGEPGQDTIRAVRITDLVDIFPPGLPVLPKDSSWSTSGDDLACGNPYPLWHDPGNRIHDLQWEVASFASDLVQQAETLSDNDESRQYARIARVEFDRALHSCQFWWASRRPMWEVNMIHRGLFQQQEALLNAARSIQSSGAPVKVRREALHHFVAAREYANRIVDALLD